jgi:glycine oxidase
MEIRLTKTCEKQIHPEFMPHAEYVIVGGGVIGLSLAWELAGQGAEVLVLDKQQVGREASWAGAGMLPPGNLDRARSPFDRLRALSARLWPRWTESLRELTGIDNGYVNSGGLTVSLGEESCAESRREWSAEGVALSDLTAEELRLREPALSPEVTAGFLLPEMAQVRNPRHLHALKSACVRGGVTILEGEPAGEIVRSESRIVSLRTVEHTISGDRFCFCTGAWTPALTAQLGCHVSIKPIRGQIVLLNTGVPVLRHIVEVGDRYLVPRPDGRLLVGSTMEESGFEKQTTVEGIAGLLDFATRLVPQLAAASIEKTWAGLRPMSATGLPFLGPLPEYDNAYVAAGHFRSGLQTSPGTAVVMRELLLDQTPSIDLAPFSPLRQSQGSLS